MQTRGRNHSPVAKRNVCPEHRNLEIYPLSSATSFMFVAMSTDEPFLFKLPCSHSFTHHCKLQEKTLPEDILYSIGSIQCIVWVIYVSIVQLGHSLLSQQSTPFGTTHQQLLHSSYHTQQADLNGGEMPKHVFQTIHQFLENLILNYAYRSHIKSMQQHLLIFLCFSKLDGHEVALRSAFTE